MEQTTTTEQSDIADIIDTESIVGLLRIGTQAQYNARELHTTNATIELQTRHLFELDFEYQLISNSNGELSLYYPRRIIIPTIDKRSNTSTSKIQPTVDIRDHFVRSRIARCRSRFVVPVILLDGKVSIYICRSATVASWGEVYSRSSVDRLIDTPIRAISTPIGESMSYSNLVTVDSDGSPSIVIDGTAETAAAAILPPTTNTSSSNIEVPQQQNIFDKLRGADIELLKMLDVDSIVNLMVEKKKTMFGVNVTSSENSDKENRYRDFQIFLLPYPGCEHFRDFSIKNYQGDKMFYDWSLPFNDSSFQVPEHLSSLVPTDWSLLKSWDSLELTKNYFQLILRHLERDDHGLLIHCISGWDRTPLFISLLRLSLWADGWIHQSLTVKQILYLTLAYDWYLFGHCLPVRLVRGEEILYFAFMILPHLASEEFIYKQSKIIPISDTKTTVSNLPTTVYSISALTDVQNGHTNLSLSHNSEKTIPQEETPATRHEKLLAVSTLFQFCYQRLIPTRLSTANSNTNSLSDSLSALDPRPIGRDIARSINNFFGQWLPQSR